MVQARAARARGPAEVLGPDGFHEVEDDDAPRVLVGQEAPGRVVAAHVVQEPPVVGQRRRVDAPEREERVPEHELVLVAAAVRPPELEERARPVAAPHHEHGRVDEDLVVLRARGDVDAGAEEGEVALEEARPEEARARDDGVRVEHEHLVDARALEGRVDGDGLDPVVARAAERAPGARRDARVDVAEEEEEVDALAAAVAELVPDVERPGPQVRGVRGDRQQRGPLPDVVVAARAEQRRRARRRAAVAAAVAEDRLAAPARGDEVQRPRAKVLLEGAAELHGRPRRAAQRRRVRLPGPRRVRLPRPRRVAHPAVPPPRDDDGYDEQNPPRGDHHRSPKQTEDCCDILRGAHRN